MKRVLCLLIEGFEEIEAFAPVDILRRAGAEVVMASLGTGIHVTGRSGITVHADAILNEDLLAETFDLLLLPGGPGTGAMRADGRACLLAKSFAAEGRMIAAICAAPSILHDAGLLVGRRFTAHFSVHEELPAARAEEAVVVDGPIITSRGAGTAVSFALALVARLFDESKARDIEQAIML